MGGRTHHSGILLGFVERIKRGYGGVGKGWSWQKMWSKVQRSWSSRIA